MMRVSALAQPAGLLAATLCLLAGARARGEGQAPYTPAQIAERAIPSVVLIRIPGGLGSGFVVSPDGRIATNLHVLNGASEAVVVLSDGREFKQVEVLGADEQHDLALIRITAQKLPALPLADSAKVRPGEHVVAIGHPLGLGNTVSDGLVSAVREVAPSLSVLQVSVPLSPGSSGGPLLNERAEVVGVSTLVVTKGQNLNFAVPVNYLKPLLQIERGTPIQAWKGPAGDKPGRRRAVPRHDASLLEGCSQDHLEFVVERIGSAISLGAPLYNSGNPEACFRIYEAAALEVNRKLTSCAGPKRALLDGVKRSEALPGYEDKAWAMRDAFDGVIDAVERYRGAPPEAREESRLPEPPPRNVPRHPTSLLKGCSTESRGQVTRTLTDAINVGGPLYNDGNFEACVRVYEGAVLEIDRKLPGCAAVKRALGDGMREADKRTGYSNKAWALRDAFDGLIDVIDRAAPRR